MGEAAVTLRTAAVLGAEIDADLIAGVPRPVRCPPSSSTSTPA